jgi:hypothetical protein
MSRASVISANRRRSGGAVAGQVFHYKDWENGIENGGGWGSQDGQAFFDAGRCGNPNNCILSDGYLRGQCTVETGITPDRGTKCGKFSLASYTASRRAAEQLYTRTLFNRHEYYAMALNFADYNWEGSFGQFNYQGVSGSPFFISGTQFTNPTTRVEDKAHSSIYALVNAGNVSAFAGATPYMSGQPRGSGYASRGMPIPGPYYLFEQDTIVLNTWYEIIAHIYWTSALDGVCQCWARKKGDPWGNPKFSISGGFPTLQWGIQGWTGNDWGFGTTDKIGIYTEADANPTNLFHDSFACCSTFEAADAFFEGFR